MAVAAVVVEVVAVMVVKTAEAIGLVVALWRWWQWRRCVDQVSGCNRPHISVVAVAVMVAVVETGKLGEWI